jgi:hypothetical protein
MKGTSPGAALRDLQRAHAGLKKSRGILKLAKDNPGAAAAAFGAGWESLTQAHRIMAAISAEVVDDAVLTKQLALQRYATSLLVRLRRLKRSGSAGGVAADDDDIIDDEDGED